MGRARATAAVNCVQWKGGTITDHHTRGGRETGLSLSRSLFRSGSLVSLLSFAVCPVYITSPSVVEGDIFPSPVTVYVCACRVAQPLPRASE